MNTCKLDMISRRKKIQFFLNSPAQDEKECFRARRNYQEAASRACLPIFPQSSKSNTNSSKKFFFKNKPDSSLKMVSKDHYAP